MEFGKFSLPPSSNWFYPHLLDVSVDGVTAYGTKSSIVVLESVKKNDCLIEKSEITNKTKPKVVDICLGSGEKAKITGVKWSPNGQMLAACTDDGVARLFSFDGLKLKSKQSHLTHKETSKDKCKINTLCWINNNETVVTGDDLGSIVIWDVTAQQTRYLTLSKNTILVMRSHPLHQDVLAYGCRYGLVYVVNISSKGRIIHKIRAHDEDIQGLDWSSETPEIFKDTVDSEQEENQLSTLLAVSSRDKTVSIWNLKDATKMAELKLPSAPRGGYKSDSPWITLKWYKSSVIVTGVQGELFQWNFELTSKRNMGGIIKSDGNSSPDFLDLHREHSKNTFSIGVFDDLIFTIGYDRSLVCYNLTEKDIQFNLPTFAGRVTCMASNSVDSSILALGSGDGLIKVWKTASTKSMFEYTTCFQKGFRGEILALTWHPQKENMLTFGTDEGRIGTLDALSPRPNPVIFDFKHRSTVYNLTYGPTAINVDGENGDENIDSISLYSLGDGIVFMHKSQRGVKPTNIEDIIAKANNWERKAPSRSELVFQPVLQKYLAIGSDDGTVEIFSMPNLKIVCTLKSFQKLIQSLAWQPFDEKRTNDLLAVASNEYDIHIWSLEEKLVKASDVENNVFTKPETVLTGHKLRVIQCVWSPYNHNQLLSVSYDGTSQVWDVVSTEGLANFRGHTSRVFCCIWGNEADLILTGGEDCMIQAWQPSKQPEKVPAKINNKVKWTDKRATLAKDLDYQTELKGLKEAIELRKSQILNNGVVESSPEPDSLSSIKETKESPVSKNKKLNKKNYFGLSITKEAASKEKVFEDITVLMNEKEVDVKDSPHLAYFSKNEKDLESLVGLEIDNSATNGNIQDIGANLYQWSANNSSLKSHLENQVGHLTDFHVNLAASNGYETWKWACSTFAKQLEEKGQVVKASSYFLMVNQVDKAIKTLVNANFFHAAMTITKTRFPPGHPMIADLYKQWAYQASQDGNYELAAKCWLAVDEFGQAAFSLSKRSDGHSLRVASNLLIKAGEIIKAKTLALQAVNAFEKAGDTQGLELMLKENDTADEVKQKVTSILE